MYRNGYTSTDAKQCRQVFVWTDIADITPLLTKENVKNKTKGLPWNYYTIKADGHKEVSIEVVLTETSLT